MSKKRLNLHEQGYKAGDPMWVSWDKRWDGPMRRELMWEAAKWLSKWSTIIGTPVTISKMNKYDNSRTLERRN